MPIALDPSLPRELYPLAWLIGTWEGAGAVQLREQDGTVVERRIEQRLVCTAQEDGTLGWRMSTDAIDTAAPLPPTSAFAKDTDVPAERYVGSGERTPLLRENGVWTVGDPLPGQDLAAAEAAKPGDPAGVISYALQAKLDSADGERMWLGEVRGPRIQLAPPDATQTRMFGYISGRVMWLWERAPHGTDTADAAGAPAADALVPYLSVELDRA